VNFTAEYQECANWITWIATAPREVVTGGVEWNSSVLRP
jgi:hypothetical protein